MSEGLIFLDNEKKVIAINKSAGDMLEVGNAGYKNVNILNISRSGELQKAINYVLENKKTYEFEVEKNKSFYKYFVCPVKNNKKEVSGIMIFIMDTTLKMLNEKMRSEFTANVSHELKTPLTSISGYAELMGQGMVKTDGDLQKIGKTIYKESARMIELVNDIMRLSQIETAVDLTDFHPVNVKPVIEDAVLTLENIAAKKEVEIECNISDAVISADKNLFFEMIYNLISNAIQYNKPSGKVNIKSNVKNDKLEITVSDTGIGIEKEHINRIFERFYRVDKSRSKQTGGTGLGLSIVKHIVNIHKGEISVSSEIERGTKITLVFPAVNEV